MGAGLSRDGERGIALVTLVFLILVLGVVAAGLAQLASTTARGALEAGDSAQAAFAAEAGLVRSLRENALAPVGVPFGGATFTVASLATNPGRREATGSKGSATRRLSLQFAFGYVPFSRVGNTNSEVEFRLENLTGAARTLTAIRVTWGSPAAFLEEVRLRVLSGTNYGPVWSSVSAGNDRLASGEIGTFNTGGPAVVVPSGSTILVRLRRFRAAETGAAALVDVDAAALRVQLRAGGTLFGDTTVRVSSW